MCPTVGFGAAWTGAEEQHEDRQLWEDNWDDDDVSEDFTAQLRKEIAKSCMPSAVCDCTFCVC